MKPLRFVLETPNATRSGPAKRPRCITSCDMCRQRKIKCVQTKSSTPCANCIESRIKCTYQGKEQLQLQDESIRESSSDTVFLDDSSEQSRSPSPLSSSPSTPMKVDQTSKLFPRYLGCTASISGRQLSSWVESSSRPASPQPSLDIQLFDPARPSYPQEALFSHLLEIFFTRMRRQFPFLDQETICNRTKSKTLPPSLANIISAISCRFSDRMEFQGTGWQSVARLYAKTAKMQCVDMMADPTIDLLHSLILIAWIQYGQGNDREYFMYSRLVGSVFLDLGMDHTLAFGLIDNPQASNFLEFTWWSVLSLDLVSSWVNGKPASLNESYYNVALSRLKSSSTPASTIMAYLVDHLFICRDVVNFINSNPYDQSGISYCIMIAQTRVQSFASFVEENFTYNESSYHLMKGKGLEGLLFLVYVYHHALSAFLHWPQLFIVTDSYVPQDIRHSSKSALAVVDALKLAQRIDPDSYLTRPFIDIPISVVARVLNECSHDLKVELCISILNDVSKYWEGAGISKQRLVSQYLFPGNASFSISFSDSLFQNLLGSPGDAQSELYLNA